MVIKVMSEKLVKVGKKFTVVIPLEIRKKVELKEGDIIRIRAENDKIIIEKAEDPYKILERVIGEPYIEEIDEKRAERFLKKCQ